MHKFCVPFARDDRYSRSSDKPSVRCARQANYETNIRWLVNGNMYTRSFVITVITKDGNNFVDFAKRRLCRDTARIVLAVLKLARNCTTAVSYTFTRVTSVVKMYRI